MGRPGAARAVLRAVIRGCSQYNIFLEGHAVPYEALREGAECGLWDGHCEAVAGAAVQCEGCMGAAAAQVSGAFSVVGHVWLANCGIARVTQQLGTCD